MISTSSTDSPNLKKRVLYVANKALPASDYRILYGQKTKTCDVIYGLPKRPASLDDNQYIRMNFGEGIAWSDIFNFLHLLHQLVRNRSKIDFTHYYSTKLVLFGPFVSALARIPSFVTITGLGRSFEESGPLTRLWRYLYLFIVRFSIILSRCVFFQNYGDLQSFAQLFPAYQQKFKYLGSAAFIPSPTNKDFHSTQLKILLVTRLMPAKGVEDFLLVARHFKDKPIEFTLIGPPSLGHELLLKSVNEGNSEGVVDYKGEMKNEALWHEFHTSHIFYFPSTYPEGLARVMLEAGLAGLCPIAYNIVSNKDLIKEGHGFLLEENDVEGAIQVINELYSDRVKLARLAHNYQTYIQNTYSIQAYCDRLDTFIKHFIY